MKQLPTIIATLICLSILTKPARAISISYDDLWDISQGNIVTAHSQLHHPTGFFGMSGFSSDSRNMFGGYFGWSGFGGWFPHYETYFDQSCLAGTIHWIEWQTPSLITLRSFNLVAMHAPPPYDISFAGSGFSQFRLQWADTSGGPWTTLYELSDSDPDGDLYYGGGPTYTEDNYLELAVNVDPTTAQYWRAEFVKYSDCINAATDWGVRIDELDGYDTFLGPSNLSPVADAGVNQTVECTSVDGAEVQLDGSGSSDPDGDPLTYSWTWDGESTTGVSPTVVLPLGTTTITLVVNDGTADSDPDTVDITVEDTTPPEVVIIVPQPEAALQDGVTLLADAYDVGGVAELCFYVREPDGGSGIPIAPAYEEMLATLATTPNQWECPFDTAELPDGYYVILAKAVDSSGNEGWSQILPFSIRNWAVVELLPASESNKAGRTMPVKFSLRIIESVDPAMPFVYNEELEVIIYDVEHPGTILQTSLCGDTSRDYRIDSVDELYITNFKTKKEPAEYVVEIWRTSNDFLVGSFTFETVN